MIIRSKAPLRIGLAGGGTDVSPYSNLYGGAILNATISLYVYVTIEPRTDGKIVIRSIDKNTTLEFTPLANIPIDGNLDLIKSVYNRIVKDYKFESLSFTLTVYADVPAGSGLGTSSTMVVAVLGAFSEWLKIPLGEYDIAKLAYEIERFDLGMIGGRQDQYAAAFGGVNFMEFFDNEKVIVNPLRIKDQILNELSNNLILFYTNTSRISSEIIMKQQANVNANFSIPIKATHKIKRIATEVKEALLKGNLDIIGQLLNSSWEFKKQMADKISNESIDNIYRTAIQCGATGGKISGAGGGGFMFFYCPGTTRYNVIPALEKLGGYVKRYEFTKQGLETWTY